MRRRARRRSGLIGEAAHRDARGRRGRRLRRAGRVARGLPRGLPRSVVEGAGEGGDGAITSRWAALLRRRGKQPLLAGDCAAVREQLTDVKEISGTAAAIADMNVGRSLLCWGASRI